MYKKIYPINSTTLCVATFGGLRPISVNIEIERSVKSSSLTQCGDRLP